MLRGLLTAVAIVLTAVASMAETHYKPHIWIGGKAGATLSRMSFSPSVPQTWLIGETAGVTFRYSEEKIFGLIGELKLTQRGWKETFEETDFAYSRTLTYIQLPVLTHIYFGSSRFKGFFNLGPEFSVMIGDRISSNFDYRNPLSVEGFPSRHRMTEQMGMDIAHRFDYGISAGAGIEFYLRPRHSLVLEGRFYYGLGNIYPSAKSDTFSASRGMSIEITLGYNFRLR